MTKDGWPLLPDDGQRGSCTPDDGGWMVSTRGLLLRRRRLAASFHPAARSNHHARSRAASRRRPGLRDAVLLAGDPSALALAARMLSLGRELPSAEVRLR